MTGQTSAGTSVPALLLSHREGHRVAPLARRVCVRQSTPSQMIHHTESLARQYELRERAVMLGWPAHQVVVIDADLGRSGAQTAGRSGFKPAFQRGQTGAVGFHDEQDCASVVGPNTRWFGNSN